MGCWNTLPHSPPAANEEADLPPVTAIHRKMRTERTGKAAGGRLQKHVGAGWPGTFPGLGQAGSPHSLCGFHVLRPQAFGSDGGRARKGPEGPVHGNVLGSSSSADLSGRPGKSFLAALPGAPVLEEQVLIHPSHCQPAARRPLCPLRSRVTSVCPPATHCPAGSPAPPWP